jgi:3-oxoacyl-[acyl-carrier protein] reductase
MDAGLRIDLQRKNALVTGGSRGVGRATAIMLARAGATVGIGYHSRSENAQATLAEVRAAGSRGWALASDIATAAGCEALFERARQETGGLDIVVVNAGIWPPDAVPIGEMDVEQWSRTMRVNLDSVFHTVAHAAREVADGGSIVLVSSTAGQRGEAYHADYAASKGAMISLTKSVAIELAARGVRVNCVAPGWIDTEMVEGAFQTVGRGTIEQGIPLGRVASAEDIAGPIIFLCSELARHITGEIVNVNGGSVLCG